MDGIVGALIVTSVGILLFESLSTLGALKRILRLHALIGWWALSFLGTFTGVLMRAAVRPLWMVMTLAHFSVGMVWLAVEILTAPWTAVTAMSAAHAIGAMAVAVRLPAVGSDDRIRPLEVGLATLPFVGTAALLVSVSSCR